MNRETRLIAATIFALLSSVSAIAQPPDPGVDPRAARLEQFRKNREERQQQIPRSGPSAIPGDAGRAPQLERPKVEPRSFQRNADPEPKIEPRKFEPRKIEPRVEPRIEPKKVEPRGEARPPFVRPEVEERKPFERPSSRSRVQEDIKPAVEPEKREFTPRVRNTPAPRIREEAVDKLEQLRNRRQPDIKKNEDAAVKVEDAENTPRGANPRGNLRARQTPAPDATPFVPSGAPGDDNKPNRRDAARERLENLRKAGGKQQEKPAAADATPYVPSTLPGEDVKPDKKDTARERMENLRNRRNQGKPADATADATPAAGAPETPAADNKGRTAPKNRLEQLRERRGQKANDTAGATPAPDAAPAGEATPGARNNRQQAIDRLKEQRGRKADGVAAPGSDAVLPAPGATPGEAAGKSGGREQRQADLNARKAQFENLKATRLQDKLTKQADFREGKQERFDQIRTGMLDKAAARQKPGLVGANIDPDTFKNVVRENRFLRKDDALTVFGQAKAQPRVDLRGGELELLNQGRLPERFQNNENFDFGRVHRADQYDNINIINVNNVNINNININIGNNYLLPPPRPVMHSGFNLSWNYWDGRSYYDHDYASSLFINVGHVRHGGYDGVMVGGGYFAYGWGFIDGCIDYGDCRIWVPGFWAPYTVEECFPSDVWVPPVYEQVWTGCCWESVMVDGGYFVPSPYSDCHLVTRHTWVPGHYEFYRC